MTRVQRIGRTRRRLSARMLEKAYAGTPGSDIPMRLFAEFAHVGGLAAVQDRGLIMTLSYTELAALIAAVPAAELGTGDAFAFARVMDLLRRLDGQPDPPRGTAVQGGDGDLDLLIASGLSPEKAAAARAAAGEQAAHEDQTRPQWAVAPDSAPATRPARSRGGFAISDQARQQHPDASADRYGCAPDESDVRMRWRGERLHAQAQDRVQHTYGLAFAVRPLLGPALWNALVAREMLGLIAAQDSSVPAEAIRAMVNGAWDQLAEAENTGG